MKSFRCPECGLWFDALVIGDIPRAKCEVDALFDRCIQYRGRRYIEVREGEPLCPFLDEALAEADV